MRFNIANKRINKGFSLLEMLVVLAIVATMTAIILGNLPSFRDTISIDLVAQQVAVAIREAQVYSMTGKSDPGSLNPANSKYWGIKFFSDSYTPKSSDTFLSMSYLPDDDRDDVGYGLDNGTVVSPTYKLGGGIRVQSLTLDGTLKDYIEIKFQRRYPEPNCFGSVDGSGYTCNPNITTAEITICSPRENKKRFIDVSINGQISVRKPIGNETCI